MDRRERVYAARVFLSPSLLSTGPCPMQVERVMRGWCVLGLMIYCMLFINFFSQPS